MFAFIKDNTLPFPCIKSSFCQAEDKVDKYTKAAAKCTSDTNSSVVGRSISVIGSDDKWRAAFKTGLFGFNQPVLVSMGPAWKEGRWAS